MSSFWWNVEGELIEIIFSLVRNGRWAEWQGQRGGIFFDYLEYEDIPISFPELEDLGEETQQMLLQVLNLETT